MLLATVYTFIYVRFWRNCYEFVFYRCDIRIVKKQLKIFRFFFHYINFEKLLIAFFIGMNGTVS